eukprot:765263-Hanusia_phi.AAC.1
MNPELQALPGWSCATARWATRAGWQYGSEPLSKVDVAHLPTQWRSYAAVRDLGPSPADPLSMEGRHRLPAHELVGWVTLSLGVLAVRPWGRP